MQHQPSGISATIESNPESGRAPASAEAEIPARRQAEDPVGDEVADHRRARIAQAAQRARRDRLEAVEQFEHRGQRQQRHRHPDDRRVVREDAADRHRRQQEDNSTTTALEERTQRSAVQPDSARGLRIAAADRLSHAHGRGRGQAQRDHVRYADRDDRDLVRRQRNVVEPADERRGGREHSHFNRRLAGRRQTQPQQLADARRVEPRRDVEQAGAVAPVVIDDIESQKTAM